MTVENFEQDPNGAGQDAGTTEQAPQEQAPVGRYSDADMAAARRSFEADASRREARLRAELEQRFIPREQPKSADPWDDLLDPSVAPKFRAALEAEFNRRNAPIREQQEDLAFKNDEARISAQYPDYQKNRDAILQFAVQAGLSNVDVAYHAWRSQNAWPDEKSIRRDERGKYARAKADQAAGTPLAEGRGGGSPSTKTNFRGKDGKLDKDAMDAAALEIMRSAE